MELLLVVANVFHRFEVRLADPAQTVRLPIPSFVLLRGLQQRPDGDYGWVPAQANRFSCGTEAESQRVARRCSLYYIRK